MFIILTEQDLARLSAAARHEIIAACPELPASMSRILHYAAPERCTAYEGIAMDQVEDATRKHVRNLVVGLSGAVTNGLRLIAQGGPVIYAQTLLDAGISIRHFQSGTTRRVRALTKDENSYLLGWDNWSAVEPGRGRFAVSPITHQSLQYYFGLI